MVAKTTPMMATYYKMTVSYAIDVLHVKITHYIVG